MFPERVITSSEALARNSASLVAINSEATNATDAQRARNVSFKSAVPRNKNSQGKQCNTKIENNIKNVTAGGNVILNICPVTKNKSDAEINKPNV